MRGLMNAMLAVEGVRRAQEKFGKGQVMTPAQARWGYENLQINDKRLAELGLADVMQPIVHHVQGPHGTFGGARLHVERLQVGGEFRLVACDPRYSIP